MTRRPPTEEEIALWRQVASGVRPLKSRRKPRSAPAATVPEKAKEGRKPPGPKTQARSSPAARPAAPVLATPAPLEHGSASGIDRRQVERFRKGRMKIDARLDLHGHTQAEAHDMLHAFLRRAHERGGRCVLVITGKGMTAGKGGVLRQAVPKWLNEPNLRRLVLAFDHATMKDGGEGALYILLKRLK